MIKKLQSIMLSVALALSIFAAMPEVANASGGETIYYYFDGITGTLKISSMPYDDYNSFDSSHMPAWTTDQSVYFNITNVVIEDEIYPYSCSCWFGSTDGISEEVSQLSNIKSIEGLDNIYMTNVTNASYMFAGCKSLTNVTVNNMPRNMDSLHNIEGMFLNTEFDNSVYQKAASQFSNIQKASYAFANCNTLKKLDVSTWTVENAYIDHLFFDCSNLETILADEDADWTELNNSGEDMFKGCYSLEGVEGTRYEDMPEEIKDGIFYARIDRARTEGNPAAGYFSYEHKCSNPSKVIGKPASCTEDGYKDCWQCKICAKYYEDEACSNLIEDFDVWKTGSGKIEKTAHDAIRIPQIEPTTEDYGVKSYWYCGGCKTYFEDNSGAPGNKIGDAAALASWKSSAGRIEKKTPEHKHTFSDEWSSDETKHWHVATCGCKGLVNDFAAHDYSTSISKGIKTYTCKSCGYKKSETLKVTVPKVTIKSVKKAKKAFTVNWSKKSVTGYEIQYALNSKFTKSKKTVKVTKASTVSKKISKLKAKKKYYVRVRCYISKYGMTYYSGWSSKKAITTK